jgi:hypothetical protein
MASRFYMAMNAKPIQDDGQGGGTISPEEIASRAYNIYEREGRVDGRHFDHWVQAESELRAERSKSQPQPARGNSQVANGDGTAAPQEANAPRGKAPKRSNPPRPAAVASRN